VWIIGSGGGPVAGRGGGFGFPPCGQSCGAAGILAPGIRSAGHNAAAVTLLKQGGVRRMRYFVTVARRRH